MSFRGVAGSRRGSHYLWGLPEGRRPSGTPANKGEASGKERWWGMVTSSLGTPSPPMPSLSLPWSWRVDFQYLLASSLLKSPAPSSPQGKVTGFPCHHFRWEDRHGCLCLPNGPPPPHPAAPGPAVAQPQVLLLQQSRDVWAGVGMAVPTGAIPPL